MVELIASTFRYLQMIIEANAHAHQLLIFDARPVVNAKVNKVKFPIFKFYKFFNLI